MRRTRSVSTSGRTGRLIPAAAMRVDGSIPEAINSSGSSDAPQAPAAKRSSTSTGGVPTQQAPTVTHLSPVRQGLSLRRDGTQLSPQRNWFPSSDTGRTQPQNFQQNNNYSDTHMQDTSTNIELMQQIQNNIVISMTSLDPQVAAEAWQQVEAARAELSATREAAQSAILQTQQAAQHSVSVAQNTTANIELQAREAVATAQAETQSTLQAASVLEQLAQNAVAQAREDATQEVQSRATESAQRSAVFEVEAKAAVAAAQDRANQIQIQASANEAAAAAKVSAMEKELENLRAQQRAQAFNHYSSPLPGNSGFHDLLGSFSPIRDETAQS